MAPEVINPIDSKTKIEYSEKCDVFSIGCIIYEL